jgi:hypothetical protein
VFDTDGKVLASNMPSQLSEGALETVGRTFSRTLEALRVARRRKVQDMDLLYEGGRLVVKNLGEGCLVLQCTPSINVPLLNLTANVVARKLQERIKGKGAASEAAPPAAPPTVTAPAAVPAAPVAEAPAAAAPRLGVTAATPGGRAALAMVEKAHGQKATVRVMGQTALRMRIPSATLVPAPSTEGGELIELAARGSQSRQIEEVLVGDGYEPNVRFNTVNGNQRMRFTNAAAGFYVEVFFDALLSYHRLEFGSRLHLEEQTLPLAELLLSQLLNVKAEDADLRLVCCLIHDADLGGPAQPGAIDAAHVAAVCADDWGWYKTVTMNLDRTLAAAAGLFSGDDLDMVTRRVKRLQQMVEEAPKSLRWQVRSRVGDRSRWYEEVE